MSSKLKPARFNVKVLVTFVVLVVVLMAGVFLGHRARRRIMADRALTAGLVAYEQEDWSQACKEFRTYLSRYPDDIEILEKFGKASLSVRPLEDIHFRSAIGVYRHMIRLDPDHREAYGQLAILYTTIRNHLELAYIAQQRLNRVPDDLQAKIWLARGLIGQRQNDQARKILVEMIEALDESHEQTPEYVEACILLSGIEGSGTAVQAQGPDPQWLDRSVQHDPESIQALLNRARSYRVRAQTDRSGRDRLMAAARADLEAIDAIKPTDPGVLLILCSEWMNHDRLDRAAAQFEILDNMDEQTILKHYANIDDWVVSRYLQESEFLLRSNTVEQGVERTAKVLDQLNRPYHRVMVLPPAIRLYLAAQKVPEARKSLDEYLGLAAGMERGAESPERIALLHALVASAENNHYLVIDLLEPMVARNIGRPQFWGLIAEAYDKTRQPYRAIRAMNEYLRLQPQDRQMNLQLMMMHAQLQDWNKVLEVAAQAHSADPSDPQIRLLCIEAEINLLENRTAPEDERKKDQLARELDELGKTHPDMAQVCMLQANLAVSREQLDAAESHLKSAMDKYADTLHVQLQLSQLYLYTGKTSEALEIIRKSCREYPGDSRSWMALAEYQRLDRQIAQAIETLRTGLDQVENPQDKNLILGRLAMLEVAAGNRREGLELFRRVAREDRNDLYVRGMMLTMPEVLQDRAEAQKLVDEIRQLQGESGLFWRLYQANVWLAGREWRSRQKEIADTLQYCIESDPTWSAPVLLLGQMYGRLGQWQNAESAYRRILSRNPSATDVADRLVLLLENQRRFPEAKEVMDRLAESPEAVSARRLRFALRTGDHSQAIDELRLRTKDGQKDVNDYVLLARLVYSDTGSMEQAFDYLDQAQSLAQGQESISVIVVRVAILQSEGLMEQARELLDDRIEKEKSFAIYLVRAIFLTTIGEFDLAEKDYLKMLEMEEGGQEYDLLARFYAETGRMDQAIDTWKEGLEIYPQEISLQRILMKAMLLRSGPGDKEEATALLESLEKRVPEDLDLLWVRSLLLLSEGTEASTVQAKINLERIVELQPTAIEAQLQLIGLVAQQDDLETVRALTIRALASNPDNPQLILARARAENGLKNYGVAHELVRMILRHDPGDVNACQLIVEIAIAGNDEAKLAEAQNYVTAAIETDPENERLWMSKAATLRASGEIDLAIRELQTFYENHPEKKYPLIMLSLSELYRYKGDLAASGEYIRKAMEVAPNSPVVLREQIVWLGAKEQYDQIIRMMSELREQQIRNPVLVDTAAHILTSTQEPVYEKEAILLLEDLTKLTPKKVDPHLRLAWLVLKEKEYDRAEKLYRRVLSLDPTNVQAINNLAWILAEDKKAYEEALKLVNRGLTLAPQDFHLFDTRGTIYSQMPGRLAQSRSDFERCVRLAPSGSPEAAQSLVRLAEVHHRLGDSVRAKESYRQALQIDSENTVFSPQERAQIEQKIESFPAGNQ